MNQHDNKHYQFQRTDPFKLGYWEEKEHVTWLEISISAVCIIVVFLLLCSTFYLS